MKAVHKRQTASEKQVFVAVLAGSAKSPAFGPNPMCENVHARVFFVAL